MVTQMANLKINRERLENHLSELSKIGVDKFGSLNRIMLSEEEKAARDWLIQKIKALQLECVIDAAANVWAYTRNESHLSPIIIGSHLDTVPNGGKYDGALGVLIGLEVLMTMLENNVIFKHPIGLVSFTGEEPNPFNLSTFGSRVVTGKLTKDDIADVTLEDGTLLPMLLNAAGGDFENIETARRNTGELAAFLEVHIEQGKRLLNAQVPIGIVSAITGIFREEITIIGEANHAGTTLMNDRKDALVAASKLVVLFEDIVRNYPSDEVVGTIGKFSIQPGAPSIIPNKVSLLLEIRGDTTQKINDVREQLAYQLEALVKTQGVEIERNIILDQAPTKMNNTVMEAFRTAIPSEESYLILGSMAGHDATHLAKIAPTGMLFVPSIDGKSHCPEEYSRIEDIEKVANVLLQSIFELDQIL